MNPDEREWQAQERAMQIERQGQDAAEIDGLAASYVSIARALRQPLPCALPDDFASRMAAQVAAQPRLASQDSRLERWMLNALGVVMTLSALIVMLIYRDVWLSPLAALLGQTGSLDTPWPLVGALCLAGSWLGEQLRRHLPSMHQRAA
jgi:hypothetical protein